MQSQTMINITEQALSLPLTGRSFLAEKLLESLDSECDYTLSSEWKNEISKRCNDIDYGNVELIPEKQVFNEAFNINL